MVKNDTKIYQKIKKLEQVKCRKKSYKTRKNVLL